MFAGKAHPNDTQGKEIIQRIFRFAGKESLRHRVVFLEDYDIDIARYMVQGADVWLNTPRRPMEACGTSGMKAAINGVLNVSILDGWWCEGYSGDRGWRIGDGDLADVARTIWQWWSAYRKRPTRWPTALAALDSMLAIFLSLR